MDMEGDAQLIAEAILALKQDQSLFKDYLFPIGTAFVSALFGGFIAWKTIEGQNKIVIEEAKLDAANKWMLCGHSMRAELIAMKANYHGSLSDAHMQRAGAIPPILPIPELIQEKPRDLVFITPSKENLDESKWNQIIRISTMVGNFNVLVAIVRERNIVKTRILEALDESDLINDRSVSSKDLERVAGTKDVVNLVDLTEKMILLLDGLLVEVDDFIKEFPKVVEAKVNKKRIKSDRKCFHIDYSGVPNNEDMLERSPEVDFENLAAFFGVDANQLQARMNTGYE